MFQTTLRSTARSTIALSLLGLVACSANESREPARHDSASSLGKFSLHVDPLKRTVTVERIFETSRRGIHVNADIVQDGNPNSNPAETFQLVTTAARLPGEDGCPVTDNCFDVRLDSFMTRDATDVTVVFDAVGGGRMMSNGDMPPANSDLSTPFGLRNFGDVIAGGSSTREIRIAVTNLDPYRVDLSLHEGPEPGLVGHWTFSDAYQLDDLTGNFSQLELISGAQVSGGRLLVPFNYARAGIAVSQTIREKTLVSWVVVNDLDAGSGSALTIDSSAIDKFDGIIYAENVGRRWQNGSNNGLRNNNIVASDETVQGSVIQMAISYEDLGGNNVRITICRNGSQIGQYDSGNMVQWDGTEAEMIFGARHTIGGQIGASDLQIEEARIYNRALTCAEVATRSIRD